jgi:dienelactone hydrolase
VTAVAIYPWCDSVGQFFSPALIISGELDDLTRPSNCERLVKSVPSGLSVPVLEIMPGAYHWFDMLHRPAQTFGGTYEYNAKATEATVNHVRSFLEGNI